MFHPVSRCRRSGPNGPTARGVRFREPWWPRSDSPVVGGRFGGLLLPQASFSGHGAFGIGADVGERQQLIDAAYGMPVDDPGDDVIEVGRWIYAVHLAGLNQRGEDRPKVPAAVGSFKEVVLAPQCDRPHGTLDGIGVDLRCGRRRGSG